MALNLPPVIPVPWAQNGNRANIPTTGAPTGRADWTNGWDIINSQPLNAGGIPPNRLDFNAVLYALSMHTVWGQSGGTYSWSSALDYVPHCMVWHNGTFYVAVVNSGPAYGGAVVPPGAAWKTFADAVVDIGNYATINLTNITTAAADKLAGAGMPGNAINISLPVGGTYTAPAAGWVYLDTWSSGTAAIISLSNMTTGMTSGAFVGEGLTGIGFPCSVPCRKGDVVQNISEGGLNAASLTAKFFYAQGVR